MPARQRTSVLTRLHHESGFTLIELLISIALFLIVAAAITVPLAVSEHLQVTDYDYNVAQQQAEAGIDSMVAQIRQAWSILSTTPNAVEMDVNLGGTAYQVLYECGIPQAGTSYDECARVSSAVGGTLPSLSTGTVVVTNMLNGTASNPVFSWAPNAVAPDYVTATVEVPASDAQTGSELTHTIEFSDGALMRNEYVEN